MNTALMKEVSEKSLAGTITFPEVVEKLGGIGVEAYRVDLAQKQKTFYLRSGEVHSEGFDFEGARPAADFSADQVAASVRASQTGAIQYREFLHRIMAAGTASYTVYIDGRKVVYCGRKGDSHVEHFPSPKR